MAMRGKDRRGAARRWSAALAVLGLVGGGAACAGVPPRPKGFPAERTVNIAFEGGCPRAVDPPVKSCGDAKPACIRARNGEQVLFQATSGGQPSSDRFQLQFDPFRGTPQAGAGWVVLTVNVYGQAGSTKEFPYNVLSGTCTPLDPQIIVTW